MKKSLGKIAERLIICGVEELAAYLENEDISLVVSVCSEEECKSNINISCSAFNKATKRVSLAQNDNMSAQSIIEKEMSKGVTHYQSLIYQTYGEFLDELTPYDMTEDEEQAYFYEKAKETLDVIENSLTKYPDKKVIIHCVYGSDRSAMVALAYFLKIQGDNADIDNALKLLHRRRPGAALDGISQQFKAYFGSRFDQYREAIIDYRNIVAARNDVPLSFSAEDFYMANGRPDKDFSTYQALCKRFGMKPF